MSLLVASSSSPSSRRDGAPSLAASRAAGPVPPLEELLLEEPLLEEPLLEELLLEELLLPDWTTALPPLDELLPELLPDELPLLDLAPEELALEEPLLEEPLLLDELLLPEELLALEAATIPSVDAATIECDVGPHGSVPVKV